MKFAQCSWLGSLSSPSSALIYGAFTLILRTALRRLWHSFQVLDDGVYIGGFQSIPEARHLARALVNVIAHGVFSAGHQVAVQRRTIHRIREGCLRVADGAVLLEKPATGSHCVLARGSRAVAILSRKCKRKQQQQEQQKIRA